jgi:hypothetical protein
MTCIIFHNWTNWKKVEEGALTKESKQIGYCIRQERVCETCNFTQLNVQVVSYLTVTE